MLQTHSRWGLLSTTCGRVLSLLTAHVSDVMLLEVLISRASLCSQTPPHTDTHKVFPAFSDLLMPRAPNEFA